MVRTTLDLDDGVLAASRALARDERISLGAAVSRLAQRGLASLGPIDVSSGFPTFAVAYDAAPVTLESVNAHRD